MPNISQIQIGDTTYEVVDKTARSFISELNIDIYDKQNWNVSGSNYTESDGNPTYLIFSNVLSDNFTYSSGSVVIKNLTMELRLEGSDTGNGISRVDDGNYSYEQEITISLDASGQGSRTMTTPKGAWTISSTGYRNGEPLLITANISFRVYRDDTNRLRLEIKGSGYSIVDDFWIGEQPITFAEVFPGRSLAITSTFDYTLKMTGTRSIVREQNITSF